MNNELKKFSEGLAEATAFAGKSTVTVKSRRRLPASGIALDGETILTAAHVIEDEENIRVALADGSEQPAKLLGYDPNSDLAVLQLESGGAEAAVTAEKWQYGELVLALGRPFGEVQASMGTLSAKGGPSHHRRGGMLEGHYRTDATPLPRILRRTAGECFRAGGGDQYLRLGTWQIDCHPDRDRPQDC